MGVATAVTLVLWDQRRYIRPAAALQQYKVHEQQYRWVISSETLGSSWADVFLNSGAGKQLRGKLSVNKQWSQCICINACGLIFASFKAGNFFMHCAYNTWKLKRRGCTPLHLLLGLQNPQCNKPTTKHREQMLAGICLELAFIGTA